MVTYPASGASTHIPYLPPIGASQTDGSDAGGSRNAALLPGNGKAAAPRTGALGLREAQAVPTQDLPRVTRGGALMKCLPASPFRECRGGDEIGRAHV